MKTLNTNTGYTLDELRDINNKRQDELFKKYLRDIEKNKDYFRELELELDNEEYDWMDEIEPTTQDLLDMEEEMKGWDK